MRDVELFQRALGLESPWEVQDVCFDAAGRRLDLRIDFTTGSRFSCPECDHAGCEVHDTQEKTWRHLDFFQHEAYLTARVPRVTCPEHGVRLVAVPWARARSGFTLLFEALVMAMVAEMPVAALARIVGEKDTRIWRIVHHYVDEAVAAQDLSGLVRAGIDDTSFRRGQSYVTVFCDLAQRRAVYVTPGRDRESVERFAGFLEAQGGEREAVLEVCQDMSEAYVSGVLKSLPNARITFDRFHIKAHLSQAVDEVRRREAKHQKDLLKNTRYLWLRRPKNLSARQQDWLDELLAMPLQTVRAYDLAQRFDAFYEIEDADRAEEYLERWIDRARAANLPPITDFTHLLKDHWSGVIRWHQTNVSNGLLEGLNSLIQASKRRARGYRSTRNFIAMIYLVAGKLHAGPAVG